jgi:2-polyprenyl-3-methyl-5-hydroxy-6-metoxy-1,4-benzoquinol methylase
MAKPPELPDANQSPASPPGGWERAYREIKEEDLPWNAGGADPELVSLVESGRVPVGRAIDFGTGPGHDAIYLAKKGFMVLAVDIAPAAIELAQANAKKAGLGVAIDYRVEDVLKLSSPAGTATFINDRGCFHVLEPKDRPAYIRGVNDVLIPGGHLFLRTFSDKEAPGPGSYRFTKKELEDLFCAQFRFLEIKDWFFEGPGRPNALICLLQKKLETSADDTPKSRT